MNKILLIPGSIRQGSYNKALCEFIINRYQTDELEMRLQLLNDIPFFNQDLETNLPKAISDLIANINWSTHIIIATPEYNNMVPGVLKNTLEWLSRGYSQECIKNKPLGIMGVSTGGFGTVRAQNQLMLLATILKMDVNVEHTLPISFGQKVFDSQSQINDIELIARIEKFINNFVKP